MSVNAATISTGGGGGGIASIPGGWRTVVIAGGALAALLAVLLQRGRGSSEPAADAADPDAQLGPNAQLAIGQIAYDQRVAFGEASMRDAAMSAQLAGLASLWETSGNDLLATIRESDQATRDLVQQRYQELADQSSEQHGYVLRTSQGIYDLVNLRSQELRDQADQNFGYLWRTGQGIYTLSSQIAAQQSQLAADQRQQHWRTLAGQLAAANGQAVPGYTLDDQAA